MITGELEKQDRPGLGCLLVGRHPNPPAAIEQITHLLLLVEVAGEAILRRLPPPGPAGPAPLLVAIMQV